MALLVSDVLTESSALLNDQSKRLFPDDKVLPFIRRAYDDLRDELMENGIETLTEEVTLTVLAGVDTIGAATTPALPTDFFLPIAIFDRASGSTEDYVEMGEIGHIINPQAGSRLEYWTFREDEIKLVPSTTNRQILLRYVKYMPTLATTSTAISKGNSKGYLAAKTAQYAARYLGENPSRADELNMDAERSLDKLVRIAVRDMQSIPFRRPYRRSR